MKYLRPNLRRKHISLLMNKNRDIIRNKDNVLKVLEKFYTNLYEAKLTENIDHNPQGVKKEMYDLPKITKQKVNKGLKNMCKNKIPKENKITTTVVVLLLDECLQTGKIPKK